MFPAYWKMLYLYYHVVMEVSCRGLPVGTIPLLECSYREKCTVLLHSQDLYHCWHRTTKGRGHGVSEGDTLPLA